MVEVTTTKPAATFLGQLLDNKPSGAPEIRSGHRSRSNNYQSLSRRFTINDEQQ